jgi:hypothetical protein
MNFIAKLKVHNRINKKNHRIANEFGEFSAQKNVLRSNEKKFEKIRRINFIKF